MHKDEAKQKLLDSRSRGAYSAIDGSRTGTASDEASLNKLSMPVGQLVEVDTKKGDTLSRRSCNAFIVDERLLLGVGKDIVHFCSDSYELISLRVRFDSSRLSGGKPLSERMYKINSIVEHGIFGVFNEKISSYQKINYGIFLLATSVPHKYYGRVELTDEVPSNIMVVNYRGEPDVLDGCVVKFDSKMEDKAKNKINYLPSVVPYILSNPSFEVRSKLEGAPIALTDNYRVAAIHLSVDSVHGFEEGAGKFVGTAVLLKDIASQSKVLNKLLLKQSFLSNPKNATNVVKSCLEMQKAILQDNEAQLKKILANYQSSSSLSVLFRCYRDTFRITPLFCALSLERFPCAKLLKDHDSLITKVEKYGITAAEYVYSYGSDKAVEFLTTYWSIDAESLAKLKKLREECTAPQLS